MFGLQLCLFTVGLKVHSTMVLLGNGMSGPKLSGLNLDVSPEAVAVWAGLGHSVFDCAA